MSGQVVPQVGSPELRLTRTFNAPRELVFAFWTDPKHLATWWGPAGFTNPVCELDVRPGGELRIHMQAPDGTIIPTKGVFREVVPPERLVFTSTSHPDKEGNSQLDVLNIVTFHEREGQTEVVLQASIIKATAAVSPSLAGMEEGWGQSLDRLAEELGKV